MPTMVLAARHMRRSSGGTTPPQVVPHAHHATSSQDEGGTATPGGVRAAAAAGSGGDDGLPRRLGIGVPAVALSQQAGQGPEEVVLFFGIIDFLQASGSWVAAGWWLAGARRRPVAGWLVVCLMCAQLCPLAGS
jgi:hypothetical protein